MFDIVFPIGIYGVGRRAIHAGDETGNWNSGQNQNSGIGMREEVTGIPEDSRKRLGAGGPVIGRHRDVRPCAMVLS
jgi:hypothetical protein